MLAFLPLQSIIEQQRRSIPSRIVINSIGGIHLVVLLPLLEGLKGLETLKPSWTTVYMYLCLNIFANCVYWILYVFCRLLLYKVNACFIYWIVLRKIKLYWAIILFSCWLELKKRVMLYGPIFFSETDVISNDIQIYSFCFQKE